MTISVDDRQRDSLLRMQAAERPYEFLPRAEAWLKAHPDDDGVRILAVREYVQLGLMRRAIELTESAATSEECAGQLADIRSKLAALPSGVVPWEKHTPRFETNLDALRRRGHDVEEVRAAWYGAGERFTLFLDRHRHPQVWLREEAGRGRWIPCLGDHAALARASSLPDGAGCHFPGPYLFEGIDLGWFFERVYQATANTFLSYSCALYVVETDPAVFALALHLHDWETLLSDARVFVFVGSGASERLRRAWDQSARLPLPTHAFRLSAFRAAAAPGAVEVARGESAARGRANASILEEVEALYAGRDVRYWARRFDDALNGGGEPLRILAAVSMHTTFLQHSMRDAQRAFAALGHRCVVLKENAPHEVIAPREYLEAIRVLKPDLFFNIDHLRPEFAGVVPANLPLFTWDQDQLPQVFTEAHMRGVAAHDFLAGCSKGRWVLAGRDPRQFLHAYVPTCPEQFSGELLTAEEVDRFACDVSYVSHASQTPQQFHEQERAQHGSEAMKRLLDSLYEIVPEVLARYRTMRGPVPSLLLKEACRRTGVSVSDPDARARLSGWYLWRLGDRWFRHEALAWAAAWSRRTGRTLRIYGNGWEDHPTLAEFAAGPAANGRELLCIYRASRINLQLMPAGFIHQRALDGLAAGGFFLSRLVPTDVLGKTLRAMVGRACELGLGDTRALVDCRDGRLRSLLSDYFGEGLAHVDPDELDWLRILQVQAELEYPDELFPRFQDVVFDSAEEFAQRAELFLDDGSARESLAREMRAVVLDKLSYRATMDRFLRAMGDYLKSVSG